MRMVLGVFADRVDADNAFDDLKAADVDVKEISVVTRQNEGSTVINTGDEANPVAEGVATGGIIGGLAGLLIGVGAIAIPGIGAVLIGGPLAAALGLTGAAATTAAGAVTGAVAGGLIGALVGLGIPEEDARLYEDRVRAGGVLLAVPATTDTEADVRSILEDNGADRVRAFTLQTNRQAAAHL